MSVLSINDEETHSLAARLANITHQSVKDALKDKLGQIDTSANDQMRLVARINDLAWMVSASPVLDQRSPEEIIGYNKIAVPR